MKKLVSTFALLFASVGLTLGAVRPEKIVAVSETAIPSVIDTSTIYVKPDIKSLTDKIDSSVSFRKKRIPDIYSLPYSVTEHHENWGRLAANTGLLFGGGITALAILQMLPEDATAWNKSELTDVPLFKRWWNHVKNGPHVDGDNPIFNFVMHPYAGAAYYMSARSQGFNVIGSFLYSAFISTVFWEYGIEAFMEIPSIQDLIITPVCGAILGEGFYRVKRWLVDNGYEFMGSRAAGYVLAFIVDPVNEFMGYFRGNPAHDIARANHESNLQTVPWVTSSIFGKAYGLTVNYRF